MNNLIAKVRGASDQTVVLTGHYDTKIMEGRNFVGANDGGSSAGFLLEMARVLCGKPRKNTVVLVWLDGEEAVRTLDTGRQSLRQPASGQAMAGRWHVAHA